MEVLRSYETQPRSPRFLDPVERDLETAWERMVWQSKEPGLRNEDFMIPAWQDESLPQVLRDRAMLSIVGSRETIKKLNVGVRTSNGGLVLAPPDIRYLRVVSAFKPELFVNWLLEVKDYESANNMELINPWSYERWWSSLQKNGYIPSSEGEEL